MRTATYRQRQATEGHSSNDHCDEDDPVRPLVAESVSPHSSSSFSRIDARTRLEGPHQTSVRAPEEPAGTCSGVIQPLHPRLPTCNELRSSASSVTGTGPGSSSPAIASTK